jgi:low affinity Fe/Cu permease
MELQIKNINEGFGELVRKLEEKKQDIIVGFQRKYKKEEQRLMNKMNQINSSQTEVGSITKIF